MWVGLISYPFFIIQFEFKLARIINGVANLNSCITWYKKINIKNIWLYELFILSLTKQKTNNNEKN